MTPELMVGIVSAIIGVGFVKIWLYKVIKYKMDEGIVQKFFEDSDSDGTFSIEVIAEKTELSQERVQKVCLKSGIFISDDNSQTSWRLNK